MPSSSSSSSASSDSVSFHSESAQSEFVSRGPNLTPTARHNNGDGEVGCPDVATCATTNKTTTNTPAYSDKIKHSPDYCVKITDSPLSQKYSIADIEEIIQAASVGSTEETRNDFRIMKPESNQNYDFNKLKRLTRSISDVEELTLPFIIAKNSPKSSSRPSGIRPPIRYHRRVVHKSGVLPLHVTHVSERYVRYLRDLVTTLINSHWRWTLLIFSSSYVFSWLLFGALWMIAAKAHGDLSGNVDKPCDVGTTSFIGFFMLAMETQITIGYGSRYPTENCPEVVFLVCIQVLAALAIQGAMVGIVYAKMVRPQHKYVTRYFSRNAVVCQRDGNMCLIFRVRDPDRSHLVGTSTRAYLLEKRHTSEGELLKHYMTPLMLQPTGMLLWPLDLVHVIDSTSPLYDVSAKDLLTKRFEIIVTLTGTSETTGQTSQKNGSYLPKEILWGHRFIPCVRFDTTVHSFVVDNDKFHTTCVVNTPLCSSRCLQEIVDELQNYNRVVVVD